MNKVFEWTPLFPLSLLIGGALLLLILESFFPKKALKASFPICFITLCAAFMAIYWTGSTGAAALDGWIAFDPLGRNLALIFLAIGAACACLAAPLFRAFPLSAGEYYFLLIAAVFGLILVGIAADFLTLFIGIETLSLALYIWCGYIKEGRYSSEAALKYFLLGALGAAFLLYGIALIYGAVGTTQFAQLLTGYKSLTDRPEQLLFLSGISLVSVGIGFKAAIFPFQVWAPDVYCGAATPVAAFMAVGTKIGAFAAFARLFLVALPGFHPAWNQGMRWLAILTLIFANCVALRQTHLRRFFAYSGIAHAGFLLIPIIVGGQEAIQALLFYLSIYALATLGAFGVVGYVDCNGEDPSMHHLKGLFNRAPLLAFVAALCLLTLAGIPPTVGFYAKLYVLKLAYGAGYFPLVAVALLTSVLSAFYYLRMVLYLFAQPEEKRNTQVQFLTTSFPAFLVVLTMGSALLFFSFYPLSLLL